MGRQAEPSVLLKLDTVDPDGTIKVGGYGGGGLGGATGQTRIAFQASSGGEVTGNSFTADSDRAREWYRRFLTRGRRP